MDCRIKSGNDEVENHWSAARLLENARRKARCFIGTIFNAFDLPRTMTINSTNLAR
jgi:hypothetical protein